MRVLVLWRDFTSCVFSHGLFDGNAHAHAVLLAAHAASMARDAEAMDPADWRVLHYESLLKDWSYRGARRPSARGGRARGRGGRRRRRASRRRRTRAPPTRAAGDAAVAVVRFLGVEKRGVYDVRRGRVRGLSRNRHRYASRRSSAAS